MHIQPVKFNSIYFKQNVAKAPDNKKFQKGLSGCPVFDDEIKKISLNSGIVDGTLSRSGAITDFNDYLALKKYGVNHIIDLRENHNGNEQEIKNEFNMCQKTGINYYNFDLDVFDDLNFELSPKAIEKVEQFFAIVDSAKKRGEKVHIHCHAGADRTGFFALLYKHRYNIGNLRENIAEMKFDYEHDFKSFTGVIPNAIMLMEQIPVINS